MCELKKCTVCKEEKNLLYFYKDKGQSSGYRPDCKACTDKRSKKWSQSNPVQRRFNMLKSCTGVDKQEYLDLLKKQDYKCAICSKTIQDNKKNLSVDHCHDSNIVRGLLCQNCNLGLGYFKDNINLFLNAIDYLNNSKNISKRIMHKIK